MDSRIARLANRFLDAYNSRAPDKVAELYSVDGWHGEAATGHRNRGRETIQQGLNYFLSAIPDATWTEHERISAGKNLLILYVLTGHLEGQLGPFDGVGQPIELRGAFALTLGEDGKLSSTLDYWEAEEFARQAQWERNSS